MFVISSLPLAKSVNKAALSYFSKNYLAPGSLIKVNVRGKNVSALVLESTDVRELKTEIKSADFQMRKVSNFLSKPFLQKEYLLAEKETAEHFACEEGQILSHLLPTTILENPTLISYFKNQKAANMSRDPLDPGRVQAGTLLFQESELDRYATYRSIIREEFAKKRSVFLCLPQNEDIKEAKAMLEKGIEKYVAAFHSDLEKDEWLKEWKKAALKTHSVLIIATARMLFIPRSDISTIIVDKENEVGWKTFSRPYFDLRFFVEKLAEKRQVRCILGDSFLRIETLWRYKQEKIAELERIKWRLDPDPEFQIIDMRETSKKYPEYRVLSDDLLKMIDLNEKNGSRMFLFAARKGLSPVTICRDCGNIVRCQNCSSPMILYQRRSNADENIFKCHQCGETRSAAEYCMVCNSWKLSPYGAGIDKVKEEIIKNFPYIPVFEIHSDVSTPKKAALAARKFLETPGSLLLGTEMASTYLHKKIHYSAIASMDSLFSIPDFRIREKIFRIIINVKNISLERFFLQSRNPEDETLQLALHGDLLRFYEREIKEREVLNYPPLGTFVKITTRGTRAFTQKRAEELKEIFSDYEVSIFPSIHEKRGLESAVNAVIKIPTSLGDSLETFRANNESPLLMSLLRSLPPFFEVKVDPENLL